jgi:hypothetical protein
MSEITITAQQIALLALVSKGEALKGANSYTSLWPSTSEPSLTQMTLSEVLRFQEVRTNKGFGSNAVGRYQFLKTDLEQSISALALDAGKIRFTAGIQDTLMITRLKNVRLLDQWLAGTLTSDKFMIRLAQEFSSIPVPYPLNGAYRLVVKGESYYSTEEFNATTHNADTFFQELEDILEITEGADRIVSILESGPNGVIPATGSTPKSQTAAIAAGIGVGAFTGGNAGARPLPAAELPVSKNVYDYRPLDPLDDRYDFRTGQTVKDLLLYGTGAAAANPIINGNIGPALGRTTNSGAVAPPGFPGPVPGGAGSVYDNASAEKDLAADTQEQDTRQGPPVPLTRIQIKKALPSSPLTGAR